VTAGLNIHLEDPVSTKIVRRELHKSNIHSSCRAAIAKTLIAESNAQMHIWWCHDHKTWTSDNWKRARDMVSWVVLHAVPHIRRSLRLENIQGSLQSGMPGSVPTVKHVGGFMKVWAAVSWCSILLVPLLPLKAKLLEGSTWTGWVNRCSPWSRRYFRTTIQFSKTTMLPFTQLELFSHGLKSIKVNLTSSPSNTVRFGD
jgi:hypothetical protein